jgi:hypothetical protein
MGAPALKSILVSITALALLAVPASAGKVPQLSGKYAFNFNITCQVASGDPFGLIETQVVVAKFNPSSGMVTMTGAQSSGELVVGSGGNPGTTTVPISVTEAYSNTDTTLDLQGVTYGAAFGPVAGGVAQSVLISGVPDSGCVLVGSGSISRERGDIVPSSLIDLRAVFAMVAAGARFPQGI